MDVKYNEAGLVPVIVQDAESLQVLMQAYMNEEALQKTLQTRQMHYFSRSRNCLWHKGETSGHFQHLVSLKKDCDSDCLLAFVHQDGVACHTGNKSCFFTDVFTAEGAPADISIISELYDLIVDRKVNPKEGAYTSRLLSQGPERIGKKVGEEGVEVVIAAMKGDKGELQYETADLIYHLLVLMVDQGLKPSDVYKELRTRRK